jgi:hypothetical protein
MATTDKPTATRTGKSKPDSMSKAKVKRVLAYKKVARHWLLFGNAAKKVEDLPFVGRDSEDRLNWWTVTPPKTDHWGVHQMLGRAYAFELLDLVHNPEAEKLNEHIISRIADAMMRWRMTAEPCAGEAIPHGFFEVLSEYLVIGRVNR